ncbi:hypothetical protein N7582_004684 [Saccharomyces uvarum]|uniref:Kri1-like C-terminal domain-containing protein n=1 Tax=Saccharomyces uvarum TaxID=230603 RepID=A0AA35NK47_SACUV|nr:hypothetical protein N7582_004684 [Saccharomyces uvarum]CAI4049507.1 hypothetical protein SUVC_14G0250 [Saccharomyces uvarum]
MPRKKSATKRAREQEKKQAGVTASDAAIVNSSEHATAVKPAVEPKEPYAPSEDEEEDDEEEEEEEDDYGELITDEVEKGINQVLDAIKNNKTDKLLDPKVKFFEDPESAASKLANREGKHRPIYLKDYHRMNILSGDALKDDEEDNEQGTVDGKQSFVSQQREEKSQLLDEIKNAFNDEDNEDGSASEDEDDGFLKKKAPSTKKEERNLPDPTVNEENFLEEFVNQQAWIPKKGDKVISLDLNNNEEEDEEFEDAVEKFENAYNFRYEDPNAAEIVSYARTQATLRRSDNTSRRRKRDDEKKTKENVKVEKETAIQKKKTKKLNKLTDILGQLTKEYGAEISADMVKKITDTLMKNDFKEEEWDNVVAELFNEEFYEQEGKPTWDENDEIMGDFYADGDAKDKVDEEDKEEDKGEQEQEDEEEEKEEEEEGPKRKKNKKEEKLQKKREKRKLNELVENALEQNKLALIEEVEKEEEERRSRSSTKEEQDLKFRYREVSPESFGLTTREIFAADDTDLNEFIGLKKFAPYRAKELRAKDKRKVTKARRLRDWRKKTFKNENGLAPVSGGPDASGKEDDSILIPVEKDLKGKHKQRHNHKHKSHHKK